MKFDSYQRFIRSNLYKGCLEAEAKHQQLPYPGGDQLDVGLRTGIGSPSTLTKLKKSLSNAEDRRRKSLLPWHRKTRCKSKDRDDVSLAEQKPSSNTLKANSGSDIHSSRSSLSRLVLDLLSCGSDFKTFYSYFTLFNIPVIRFQCIYFDTLNSLLNAIICSHKS